MNLQPWFKPRYSFVIGDDNWISDGIVALIAPDPGGLKTPADAASVTSAKGDKVRADPCVSETKRVNGHAEIGGRLRFQAHYIDLIVAAHPEVTWRIDEESAMGFVGDVYVCVVMSVRVDGGLDAQRLVGPACPMCDGDKGPECKACDGAGRLDCECDCGHEHDKKCDDCDGAGITGKCAACKGSGFWTAEQTAA